MSDLDETFKSLYGDTPNDSGPQEAEFQAVETGIKAANKQQAQGGVWAGSKKDPERTAKVYELARQMRMPRELVERNYENLTAKRAPETTNFDSLVEKYPSTTEFLKNPENAAIVHDEIDALKKVEDATQEYGSIHSAFNNINYSFAQLGLGAAQVPAYFYDAYHYRQNRELQKQGKPQIKAPDWLRDNALAKEFKDSKDFWETPEISMDAIEEFGKGNIRKGVGVMMSQVAANSANLMAIAINPIAGPVIAGLTTASASQGEGLEKTDDVNAATLNSTIHGTIEVAFERLGTSRLLKGWENAITKKYGKDMTKKVFADFGKTMAASFFGEATEEALTEAGQSFSSYATGVDENALTGLGGRMANAGLIGGASGGTLHGPLALVQAAGRGQLIRQAAVDKDSYLKIGEAAAATKLQTRSGELQMEFMQENLKDSQAGTVNIPIAEFDKYFEAQGIPSPSAAHDLGITENVELARTTGNDIEVPMALWTAKLAGTPHFAAMADHIKFNPEGMTTAEVATQKEVRAQVEKEADKVQNLAKEEQQKIVEVEKIFAKKLRVANLSPEQAKLARGIGVMALAAGEDPVEYVNKLKLTIRGGIQVLDVAQGEGESFNQEQAKAPTFFNRSEQILNEKMGTSATVEQVNGVLREIKPEERKWLGIDEFLKGKTKVSKAELLAHIQANNLQIEEKVFGQQGEGLSNIEWTQKKVNQGFKNPDTGKFERFDVDFYAFEQKINDIFVMARIKQNPFTNKFEIQASSTNYNFVGEFDNVESAKQAFVNDFNSRSKAVSDTQYGQYQLEGERKNYKELLFKLPPVKIDNVQEKFNEWVGKKYGDKWLDFSDEKIKEIEKQFKHETLLKVDADVYKAPHYGLNGEGLLAHTRISERVDSEGKRVLMVEEIQSDLHQEGRKKGYKENTNAQEIKQLKQEIEKLDKPLNLADWAKKNNRDLEDPKTQEDWNYDRDFYYKQQDVLAVRINELAKQVPDAPFKKTWHEFVMKRLVRYAAENGFDKVAWTTGEQQADRYDLSKSIETIQYNKNTKTLFAENKQGGVVIDESGIEETSIADYIGKEAAEKILKEENGLKNSRGPKYLFELSGVDLKVGGEGMKGFYDKILVDYAKKLGKKFGATVGEVEIKTPRKDGPSNSLSDRELLLALDQFGPEKTTQTVHSLEITPALRDEALNQGFSLFQGEGDPLGKIHFGPDGINIDILAKANASTFIHELGHLYLEVMKDLSQKSPEIKKDLDTILKWFEVDSVDKIETKHHEMFARGFERYIGEGVAPTKDLKSAFKTFSLWITSVYKTLTNLNVKLTPEVREVFDRMISTELERAKADLVLKAGPLFGNPAAVGMGEKETIDYRMAESEAQDAAQEILMSKTMEPVKQKQAASYKARREVVKAEITKQANETNTYRALFALQKQTNPDGTPLPEGTGEVKIDPTTIPPDFKGKLPRGVTSKTGLPAASIAQLFGFESGNQLLETLSQAPNINALIEQKTDEQMALEFPDIMDDADLLEQASMAAQHNDNRAKRLELELKYLVSEKFAKFQNIVKKTVRRVPTSQQIRVEARKIIDDMVMSNIKPYMFERAERRAAKEAGEWLAKGDIEKTFDAKRRELLNHELHRAATEALELKDKFKLKNKRFQKSDEEIAKTRDVDLVYAAKAILADYGLIPSTDNSVFEYMKKLQEDDLEAYNSVMTLVASVQAVKGNHAQVTFAAFQDMVETVEALWSLAKTQRQLEVNGEKIDRAKVVGELNNRIGVIVGNPKDAGEYTKAATSWDKAKVKLLGWRAALTRVEGWAQAMGPEFTKYIWNPISEAVTNYRVAKRIKIKEYLEIIKEYSAHVKQGEIKSPELNHIFKDKFELTMAILHTGNYSNKSKLLRGGRGEGKAWGALLDDGTVDESRWQNFINRMYKEGTVTKADMDFAQKIWDLNETMVPDAQRAHKRMFGYYFSKVTAQEIVTPFGNYRGGYIPAKADTFIVEDAKIRADKTAFEQENNSFMFPTTGRGFTKNRVEAYAAALDLNIQALAGHIDSVLRFSHIEPINKEVSKIAINKGFRSKLAELDPEAGGGLLVPWLQRASSQKVITPSKTGDMAAIDNVARILRRNVSMQIMTLNLANALQQFTGIFVTMTKVKPRHVRGALADYIVNRKQFTQDIMDKSKFMNVTAGSTIYDMHQQIEEIIINPNWLENAQMFSRKHGQVLQSIFQGLVNNVSWVAAYNQAVEEKMSEVEAVRFADSVVRTTQGTSNPEDISTFETGSATKSLFTHFANFFNMLANLHQSELLKIHRDTGLRRGAGKVFYLYLLGMAVPAALSKLITQTMAGQGFDADDDDEYLDDLLNIYFGGTSETLIAMVPWVGQFINASKNAWNDKPYDDRMNLSPTVNVLETMAKTPSEVYKAIFEKQEIDKKTARDVLMSLGTALGVPLAPLGKPIGYQMDVNEGKTEPTGPIDYTRGLITGKGK